MSDDDLMEEKKSKKRVMKYMSWLSNNEICLSQC